MYPAELEIKDTTDSVSASYLDVLLSIWRDGQLHTSIYDKRDDFNFHIYSDDQKTFQLATQTGIPRGTLEIVIQEVLWSIRGSYSAIWSFPLTIVKWNSDPWPTVTSQPIRISTNFMTLMPTLTFTELWVVSIEHLQRVWHASRGHLPFRTFGNIPLFWDLLVLQLLRTDSSNFDFTRLFTSNTPRYFLEFA